jgi:hypothetical protein
VHGSASLIWPYSMVHAHIALRCSLLTASRLPSWAAPSSKPPTAHIIITPHKAWHAHVQSTVSVIQYTGNMTHHYDISYFSIQHAHAAHALHCATACSASQLPSQRCAVCAELWQAANTPLHLVDIPCSPLHACPAGLGGLLVGPQRVSEVA